MQVLNPIDVRVGLSLRRLRFRSGLALHRFAKLIGVKTARLLEFESGNARIDARLMVEMCRVLDVRPMAFFEWSPSEPTSDKPAPRKLNAA